MKTKTIYIILAGLIMLGLTISSAIAMSLSEDFETGNVSNWQTQTYSGNYTGIEINNTIPLDGNYSGFFYGYNPTSLTGSYINFTPTTDSLTINFLIQPYDCEGIACKTAFYLKSDNLGTYQFSNSFYAVCLAGDWQYYNGIGYVDTGINCTQGETYNMTLNYHARKLDYIIDGISVANDTLVSDGTFNRVAGFGVFQNGGGHSLLIDDITITSTGSCVENWTCTKHNECNPSNISECTAVIDNNNCYNNFTGNLSTFDNACNYNDFDTTDIVLITRYNTGVLYKSTDGGKTFDAGTYSSPAPAFALFSNQNASIIISGSYGDSIWVSYDGGSTWNEKNSDINRWYDKMDGTPDAHYLIISDFQGELWVSYDYGNTWQVSNNNTKKWSGVGMSKNGQKMFAQAYDDKIYRSTDAGRTWSVSNNDTRSWVNMACDENCTRIVALAQYSSDVYVSTDGGDTWNNYDGNTSSTSPQSVDMTPDGQTIIVTWYDESPVISHDGGSTWYKSSNLISVGLSGVATNTNGTLFIAGSGLGYLYRSIDGINWYTKFGDMNRTWYGIYIPKQIQSTIPNCTPNWTCDTYSACNSSNIMPCTSMADINFCGTNFTGNISDYNLNCTYTPPIIPSNATSQEMINAGSEGIINTLKGFGAIATIIILIVVGAVAYKIIKKK